MENREHKRKTSDNWIPEFLYEEGAQLPFVDIPEGCKMPEKLFVYEYQQTEGREHVQQPDGTVSEIPVYDVDIGMWFSYKVAKEKLDAETLDKVRVAFGLDKLEDAAAKGQALTKKIQEETGNNQ